MAPRKSKTLEEQTDLDDRLPLHKRAVWVYALGLGNAAFARLVELGEIHPRDNADRPKKTHLASVLLETQTVHLTLVEQGYLAALQGERINHEQTVERIRQAHRLGLEIARRVARGEPVCPGLPRGAVRRALDQLEDTAVIESGGRGHWHLTDPLLRRYLRDLQRLDTP